MSARPPNHPYDTLQIHCLACGRFLQAWVRSRVGGLIHGMAGPMPAQSGKGVRVWNARSAEDFERGGGSTERTLLQHRCRAHNGRELPTVVNLAKVTKLLDEKVRRVDW